MVLSRHPVPGFHPNAQRIFGLVAAITVNAALLMLLLVPMRAPPPLSASEVVEPIRWILPATKKPDPVPLVPIQPRTPTTPQPRTTQPRARTTEPPVVFNEGSIPVDLPVDTTGDPTVDSIEPAGALPGVRLEYAYAPAPVYPRDALRAGVQGTVMLQVLVDVDGRALRVDVQQSSGDKRLDRAARNRVLQWRFRPAMQDGRAVQALGLVPIAFNLDR